MKKKRSSWRLIWFCALHIQLCFVCVSSFIAFIQLATEIVHRNEEDTYYSTQFMCSFSILRPAFVLCVCPILIISCTHFHFLSRSRFRHIQQKTYPKIHRYQGRGGGGEGETYVRFYYFISVMEITSIHLALIFISSFVFYFIIMAYIRSALNLWKLWYCDENEWAHRKTADASCHCC